MQKKKSVELHAVRAVLKPVHSATYDRFFFSVEWEEKDENGKHKVSTIPLENFIDSPSAIFVFGKKWRSQPLRPKKDVKRHLKRRVCATEYIPNGTEFVKKVYNSTSLILKGNAEEFYCVKFWGDNEPREVRLLFMEFYFPRELLLYWIEKGRSGPRYCK
jgi:hypothetical protein